MEELSFFSSTSLSSPLLCSSSTYPFLHLSKKLVTCCLAKKMSNTLSSDEADCHWAASDEGSALCGLCFPQMNLKCNLNSVRGEIWVKKKLHKKRSSIHHTQLVQNFSLHFWLAEICLQSSRSAVLWGQSRYFFSKSAFWLLSERTTRNKVFCISALPLWSLNVMTAAPSSCSCWTSTTCAPPFFLLSK